MYNAGNIVNQLRGWQMRQQANKRSRKTLAGALALGVVIAASVTAKADEGGVSFWVPGFFGSLAATPQQAGWSFATIYYHTSVSAGSDVALAREFQIGKVPANLAATLNANLKATADLGLFIPSYVFGTPVLGGQAAFSLLVPAGRSSASLNGTLSGTLGTPLGSIAFTRNDSISDSVTGFGDLVPNFAIRWNAGVNNYMAYVTGDIPVGAYDPNRLANLGIGHGAIDIGGGYTYFNPQTGHEFSAVLGFTGNFKNPDTQYKNGVDMHLDMAASQFLTKQWQVGLVGYAYRQLSCDSGSGDRVGCFESQVFGIGPQIAYIFPIGTDHQGYLNLKGYKEFDADHRADGWNVWLTLAISPAAPSAPPPATRPMITK
jgi:hypothetical protein